MKQCMPTTLSSELSRALGIVLVAATLAAPPVFAQSGALPTPDPVFKGIVGKTFKDAKPDFPQPLHAPKGAPNVVVILLDDLGFGQPGTFGGPIPTPNLDKLAAQGLRYNRFHTTGICSPTRAALLTGRNHHQAATGTITELSTGFDGYNSVWPRSTASVARVLKESGYSTAAWGKWHNTPDWETSPVGPFNHWPTGLGFEYWYGFHGGDTSQYEPQLFRDTRAVEPPKRPEQGYHLTEDLADDAIAWVNRQKSIAPDKPYFMYFATGAVHAPLHVPTEWSDRFKGQFDQGWDKLREETFARQKRLGVIPANTKLTPRPKQIEAWDSLSPDAKKLYARHMEVFAGFLAHTDHHIGRLLAAIAKLPDADNTLILYVTGDNGPSAEGMPTGTLNEMMGLPDAVAGQLAHIGEIGGPLHTNHYPVGWAWAGSAPFQWMKRVPSHFGGTRNGMVVSWPAKITDRGGLRTQFHHVIDVVPTIYRAAGITPPNTVDGIQQKPFAGVDMSYSFADSKAPGTRTTQYFEIGGHRAIYKDGWVAASFHGVPWQLIGSVGFDKDNWTLYNIDDDFSEADDLAAQNPAKLKQLQQVFDTEAKKYSVYPLDDRFAERLFASDRPSMTRGRTNFRFSEGATRIPEGSAPRIHQRSHRIIAKVEIPDSGVEGVIIAAGGSTSGYTLFVQDGRLHYEYNWYNKARYRVSADGPLPSGKVEIVLDYQQLPFKPMIEFTGGPAKLYVDGRLVGEGLIGNVNPFRFSFTETMDVGMDLGAPVAESYRSKVPFAFTGKIEEVRFELK